MLIFLQQFFMLLFFGIQVVEFFGFCFIIRYFEIQCRNFIVYILDSFFCLFGVVTLRRSGTGIKLLFLFQPFCLFNVFSIIPLRLIALCYIIFQFADMICYLFIKTIFRAEIIYRFFMFFKLRFCARILPV